MDQDKTTTPSMNWDNILVEGKEHADPTNPNNHYGENVIVDTDEVVDTINKFRKNLLDENPDPPLTTFIKEYTSPEGVVNVIGNLRNCESLKKWQKEMDDSFEEFKSKLQS